MNTVTDYIWYGKDKEWQEFYADKFQELFRSQGISEFKDQLNLDSTEPELVVGYMGCRKTELWNAKLKPYIDGYFGLYYGKLLYLFSLLYLSGKYQIIIPQK
ncbi:hypothetical protein QUH73_17010 [Labilibaculum sp. K2S]|uniref:hypothetical protein n=1 Tax=Labilibaculum sp. K2S TaxID=3056386 RepID=UPI0025A34DD0|nr:hypothetical protein [Labilibaculum sp. K2S]MDM8161524.1 hypothetical protein [Labilibaculum sp. K2S]